MAGIRRLLEAQPGNEISQVSAFTVQNRDYLPPVDSANAILKTRSGATGSFQISVASSTTADEWTVECEHGWVKIEGSRVTVSRDGKSQEIDVPNERTGVPPEVRAWGEALSFGKPLKELEPEAALADLELVSLSPPT
jgi:predicted dehydrogenase